uniref:Uncharacterized protein n=1 Tax=Glossina palpalis gambiensis TaxID=67801 RepID=A0A1B0C458_9MUSC
MLKLKFYEGPSCVRVVTTMWISNPACFICITVSGPDNDGSKEKRNFWNKCEEEHLTARPKIGSSRRKDKVQSQNEEATGSAQKQKDEKKRSTAEKPSEDARPT